MDLPAPGLGVQEQMQHPAGGQAFSQGVQARLRPSQVVEHPDGVDGVERPLVAQLQQAALLDAQLAHPLPSPGAAQPFPRHLQGTGADVHREHRGARVEMAEVIGAHARAAPRVEHPPRPGATRRGSGWQRAPDGGHRAVDAPAPVVTGRWAILKRIPWIGEAVVKGAHHRRGGVRGEGGRLRHERRLGPPDSPMVVPQGTLAANICSCLPGGPGGQP